MTTAQRMIDRPFGRLPPVEEDRGSMAMAMMAVLVGAMLGGLMLPMVIAQNRSTQFDMARVRNLHAAETGVSALVGLIRASTTTDDSSVGNLGTLPCSTSGKVNGSDKGSYTVTVKYYSASANPADAGTVMGCPLGYSTLDAQGRAIAPRYAEITSVGTGPGGSHNTIMSTYTFQTDDSTVAATITKTHEVP